MRTNNPTWKAIEQGLARSKAVGFDTDYRLATTAELIAEAEATFRKLAEPRLRE